MKIRILGKKYNLPQYKMEVTFDKCYFLEQAEIVPKFRRIRKSDNDFQMRFYETYTQNRIGFKFALCTNAGLVRIVAVREHGGKYSVFMKLERGGVSSPIPNKKFIAKTEIEEFVNSTISGWLRGEI